MNWVETVVSTGVVLTGVPLEVLKKAAEGNVTIYFFFSGFKLSPCFECFILSFVWFPGVWILCADVSEHYQFYLRRWWNWRWKWQCSEMSAHIIQTPENHPHERIQHIFSFVFNCIFSTAQAILRQVVYYCEIWLINIAPVLEKG